jgi:hypothetical protein
MLLCVRPFYIFKFESYLKTNGACRARIPLCSILYITFQVMNHDEEDDDNSV